jgi:hypothetical protein
MLTKMNREEFINMVIGLQQEKKVQFCTWIDEDGEGLCWYTVQKMNWIDSEIIIIGGYGQSTECLDITKLNKRELQEYVVDFIVTYFEHIEYLFVNMSEIEE